VREDFSLADGRHVMVMDWVEGTDLSCVLRTRGDPGLPVSLVLDWLGQVAETLDHLHRHRPAVVHGDVKPANLVLTDDRVVLDIHGGALILQGGPACAAMTVMAAARLGLPTWGVDYRMPPDHPYPTPLDDCVRAYRALLEDVPPDRIVVAGGSAGGNLAAALVVRARDEGLPLPAAVVLATPEVDLTESGDSFATNLGVDSILGRLMPVNELYAAGHDLAHPYLSPLFADLTGFPPTILTTGTRDLFLSNTVRMHRALRRADVEAELHVLEAAPHGGFLGMAPEDAEIAAEVRRFIDNWSPPTTEASADGQ